MLDTPARPVPRDFQRANRTLLAAMHRQRRARKHLDQATRDVINARTALKRLIELASAAPPEGLPWCAAGDHLSGTVATCLDCQAINQVLR